MKCFTLVAVAQLVERWIVDPAVTGSIPVSYPKISGELGRTVKFVATTLAAWFDFQQKVGLK